MVKIIKKYWLLILIGLILRVALAAFTFHPDAKTPALASAVVLRDGQLNFYQDSGRLSPGEILDDLPLSYFISLPIHTVARVLVNLDFEINYFKDSSIVFGTPVGWLFLLYTKLPMIIFDLALGILLALCVSEINQRKILKLWMFNPLTLWVCAAIGQADIYPAFFIVLAFFMIKKGRLDWAALSLGAGGAIKSVPFLLLPFLLGLTSSWKERFKLLIISLIPYLVTVLPYLPSAEFRRNALFAPQLDKTLFAKLPLSGGEAIYIVPAILLILYFIYLQKRKESFDFLKFSITSLLVILSFTHFHMQWFLWVLPLLFLWLIDNKKEGLKLAVWGLIISLLIMLFMFDSSLQLKLFAPLIPSLDGAKGLAESLSTEQVYIFRSLAATLFLGSSVFVIWNLFKNHD